MSDGTKIEWTDATWNVVTGCSVVSPGCTNCYAMRLAGTRLRHHPSRVGLTIDTKAGPVWNGQVRFNEQMLRQPLQWKRPRLIFVCAHADLFHENVPEEWIDRVFAVMAACPQHTFQVLTKRPERMRDYCRRLWACGEHALAHIDGAPPEPWPFTNVWLGVSVEDQKRANERIPHLLATPAAVRWLSMEPLLGPVDLTDLMLHEEEAKTSGLVGVDCLTGVHWDAEDTIIGIHGNPDARIDWVVVGGESGPRPMHPDWARSIRDQCADAGVPFLFKQWGTWSWVERSEGEPASLTAYRAGKKAAGRLLDGIQHDGFPVGKGCAE